MTSQQIPRYTYNDYRHWKEDWELIGGYPYSLLPVPILAHGLVMTNVIQQSKNSISECRNNNCLVVAMLDWCIDDSTVVRTDLMIIGNEPGTDYVESPPTLILEILSPSTRRKDRNEKYELYRLQGVKYYLMADYEKKMVEVLELIDNVYRGVEKDSFLLEPGCTVAFDYTAFWD